ncbi:MAG: peptide deformylase [Candidatus Thorarchaeota archaeon]
MNILIYPDERLKVVSTRVEDINSELCDLISIMNMVMYDSDGLGLAAIQVGIDKRFFVYDILRNNKPKTIINPEIIYTEGITISEGEGCLSLPGITSNLKRAKKILVGGVDINGKEVEVEADGLLSILFQHEIDHLNGFLLIDHFSSLKRKLYEKKLKKIKKY